MKLVQNVAFAAMAVVALFGLEGCACGSHASAQAAAPKPIVATTQIMAAEISDSDNAPHVGKSHRSASTNALVEANANEDGEKAPARDDRKHHNGGGFSGWK